MLRPTTRSMEVLLGILLALNKAALGRHPEERREQYDDGRGDLHLDGFRALRFVSLQEKRKAIRFASLTVKEK